MNEKTFNELFPEVQLSVCPHEIQNFGNSVADISMLGQFHTYLEFRGKKYLNTFIVMDANDCPNLLSHGATFRMSVLLSNYSKDMVIDGENVPHFSKMSGDKMRAPNDTLNVFQILANIWKQQQAIHSQCKNPESESPFRTTTPSKTALTTATAKQANPVHAHTFPAKYFIEWTSNTWCTCSKAAATGSEAQRLSSLNESPAHQQWQDFCEQTPIDEARDSVTLLWLL